MGLLVVDHLQTVLETAQETIVALAVLPRQRKAIQSRCRQRAEHVEGARSAQRGVAAAGDELLGLHEELDFADAATAELDVVAPRPRSRHDP